MWHEYFARILEENFQQAKKRNKSISLRAYAKRIETSPGMLSEITRGRRHVSWDRALKMVEKAKFPESVRKNLERLYKKGQKENPRLILKEDALELIFNPLYYRALCAFEIFDAPASARKLADHLGCKTPALETVLRELLRLGIIDKEEGGFRWKGQHLTTPPNVASQKVQKFFLQDLKRAAKGLEVPSEKREYTMVTFAGNGSEMAQAKKNIRQFRDQISNSMQVEPNQIFEFSLQLRPVSKIFKKGSK